MLRSMSGRTNLLSRWSYESAAVDGRTAHNLNPVIWRHVQFVNLGGDRLMTETQKALAEFLSYLPESMHPRLKQALEQLKEAKK